MPFGACGIPLRNSVTRFVGCDLHWQTHCQALVAAVEEAVAEEAVAEEADRGQEFGLSRTDRHSNCARRGSTYTRLRCLETMPRYSTPTSTTQRR